jgi:hypothetical protein
MQRSFSAYLGYLFQPFFRAWWAAITGCASILALFITPRTGVLVSGGEMMTLTFAMLLLAFLTLSVFVQGWRLYRRPTATLHVDSFERNRDVQEGWLFVLSGDLEVSVGTVLDVHKRAGAAEVPLALVRVIARNSSGAFQAAPIGKLNPLHLREHSAGGLKPEHLVVRSQVDLQRIKENLDDLR